MSSNGNIFCIATICVGNSPVPGGFPTQRPVMFSLIYVWINGSVNNREAGDLRHYRAHYDIIMTAKMYSICQKHPFTIYMPPGHC